MSMRQCAVVKCNNQVREGLRRHGKAGDGSDLADGRICWRCRRSMRDKKSDQRKKR